MRILAASDIHGSSEACERIIKAFFAEKADILLLLGDLLYHGPRNSLPDEYSPKSVAEQLNSIKKYILCVRGNCDTEVDQMVLDFPVMAEYIYIVSGEKTVFATHGHRYGFENPPFLREGSILLTGHTHITADIDCGGFRYMNPGSPSIPKGGTEPSYIILENGNAQIRKL